MTPKIKVFLATLILSLPFWWGVNLLEAELKDFFFWNQIAQNPQILAAQASSYQKLQQLPPIPLKEAELPEINAKSAISVFIDNQAKEKILFQKSPEEKLPIASLTKLMTAKVVLDYYDPTKEIIISKEAVMQEEDFGKLQVGRNWPAEYLLYPLLMESSNDAAFSFANDYEGMTEQNFVSLMNLEAEKLGLANTSFTNPTGLDPEDSEPKDKINLSTAKDLAELTKELLNYPLIWQILTTAKFSLYGPELENNNALLGEIPGITGGKTGYTEEAGKCMILVLTAPKGKGKIINVTLGAGNKFGEMTALTDWVKTAFKW